MLICSVQDCKNLCKRKQLIRFNDACQEAAVCRETQLASFGKLFDIHISLVRGYQLCQCHGAHRSASNQGSLLVL